MAKLLNMMFSWVISAALHPSSETPLCINLSWSANKRCRNFLVFYCLRWLSCRNGRSLVLSDPKENQRNIFFKTRYCFVFNSMKRNKTLQNRWARPNYRGQALSWLKMFRANNPRITTWIDPRQFEPNYFVQLCFVLILTVFLSGILLKIFIWSKLCLTVLQKFCSEKSK